MSLIDFSQFKTLKELQEYADKQFHTIMTLERVSKEQADKIKHLENLLAQAPVKDILLEDKEIEICKMEINRLYNASMNGPLEDVEVKKLEILVKTLATARGKSVGEIKEKKDKQDLKKLPQGKLIELAKMVKDEK